MKLYVMEFGIYNMDKPLYIKKYDVNLEYSVIQYVTKQQGICKDYNKDKTKVKIYLDMDYDNSILKCKYYDLLHNHIIKQERSDVINDILVF